jgi:sugar phosphate isomerase/epimerase
MNFEKSEYSRRQFLTRVAAAAWASQVAASAVEIRAPGRFPIIAFTKPFQNVGFQRTAEIVEEVGWSGIECPVRAKGQILPERVEEDLAELHRALNKCNLDLALITTDITELDSRAEKVLRTAAELGVKRYRLSAFRYDLKRPLQPQLAELKARLRDLNELNRELGLRAGLQNHSGGAHIGAPVWDIFDLIHDVDPEHLGTCFDIGHATVEGGLSWPIQARLMEPFFTCVYVKDFTWEKGADGWTPKWGPLGEGMVRKEFFTWLKQSDYRGPISQHCEYLEGDGPEQIKAMKKDLLVLRQWLGE